MNKKLLIIASVSLLALQFSLASAASAQTLGNKLKGKILLQVESHGEAWYVNTKDEQRYYLGKPSDAYQLIRELGIGISNANLEKIQIGDSFSGQDSDNDGLPDTAEDALGTDKNKKDTDGNGIDDKTESLKGDNPVNNKKYALNKNFTDSQKGKIFLQVESHGEAWYVNPADGKRYFLARPQDAFNIMRKLGTGIKCSDLNKITPSKDHNIDTTAGNDSESNLNNNTGDNNDNSYNYSDDNSSGDSSQSGQEKPNYKTASKLTTITFSRVITGPYNTYNNAGARNQSVSLKITGYLKEIDPDANEFTRYGDKGYDFDQGAVEWTIDELENDGNTTGCNYITSAAGSGKDSIANLDVPYDTNNGKDSNGNIAHLSSFDLKLKYVNTGLTGKSELSIAGSLLIPIDVTETVIHGKSNLICGSTTQTTAVSRKDAAVAAFPLKLLKTSTGASLKGSLSAYETSNYFNNTSNIVSGTTDAQFGIPVFTGEGAYDIDSAPWNVTWEIEFPE